ncbi:hypothetical protein BH10BAC6_BH10BAC6_17020 [soil metagenome]
MQFTSEQQAALALDRHLAVTANAGSGKTSVLTQRFISILLDNNTDLRHVVAITFTTKAAAEMRRKVREELVRRKHEGSDLARLTELTRTIGSSRISTIHSFCASLLRRYAHEAGIDTDVRDITEREAYVLKRDAVSKAIRSWLHDEPQRRIRALQLFDEISIDAVEGIVQRLTATSERRSALRAWFDQTPSITNLAEQRLSIVQTMILECTQSCVNAAAAMAVRLLHDEPEKKARDYVSAITSLRAQLNTASYLDATALAQSAFDVLNVPYTLEGLPKKKPSWCQLLHALPPSTTVRQLRTFASFTSNENDEQQLRFAQTLLEMSELAALHYEAAKRERGGMDFDDMMTRARDLLLIPSVAADVRKNIHFLMIDEFQDTNPLQYEVVRLLVPDLDPTRVEEHVPNLFLVGDAKQSIYGFRDADVRIFDRACDEIDVANARKGLPSGRITLRHSFRMAPPLATAVNRICEDCFTQQSDFDVVYEPLVAGRDMSGTNNLGTMHMLFTDRTTSKHMGEATHVSNMICKILNGAVENIVARPGDIAILTRTASFFEDLGTALREAGVPFQVHGGRAFFSRPEVADIRALLTFASDPSDDVALATLLRSPICCWTDADILKAMQRSTDSLWSGVEDGSTRTLLARCVEDIHVLQPSVFVRRALEEAAWYATVATDPRCEQIITNVEKVLAILRDEAARGIPTLRDMIAAIAVPATADREAEGTFEADASAVQIMTLHAAKGLEFPVVILAGINNKGGMGSTDVWTDSLGLTLSLPKFDFDPTSPLKAHERLPNAVHSMNSIVDDEKGEAEDKRLLYVGLTRAKDHCVVSLPYTRTKAGIGTSYGIGALLMNMLEGQGIRLDLEPPTDRIMGSIQPWYDTDEQQTFQRIATTPTDVISLDAPIDARPGVDIIYVTDLLDQRALEDHASDVGDADRGAAFGTIVHAFLQRTVPRSAAHLDIEETFRVLRADPLIQVEVGLHAEQEVRRVLASAHVRDHAHALSEASYEQTIASEIDGTVVLGTMDVRLHTSATSVEVWDWKTTSVATVADREAAAHAYRSQLCAYAWMCFQANPELQRVTGKILFTRYASNADDSWIHTLEWKREDLGDMRSEILRAIDRTVERRMRRSGLL